MGAEGKGQGRGAGEPLRVPMPIDRVLWVAVEKCRPNDYNPNAVPPRELALLKTSILADGFTQPIVTMHDPEADVYEIVDGFHRWSVGHDPEVRALTGGQVPIVVIEKGLNERMAATVRHNRARGSHAVRAMGDIVHEMAAGGWSDPEICAQLGLSADELVRTKHLTGVSKLLADTEHSRAWVRGSDPDKLRAYRKRLEGEADVG